MAIQKVNMSFKADFRGQCAEIIKNAVKNGMTNNGVKTSIDLINTVCPGNNNRVYMYCRPVYKGIMSCNKEFIGMRSGVKVVKDGKIMEKNVDPRGRNPKDLFHKFAITVKRLVNGEIQPDENIKLFK